MDIMNIMKVSSSKFTFTLIAIAALFVGGSGLVAQDAFGAVFDAPEFTCNHINTTATHCTFDMKVNGTLRVADWGIDVDGARTAGDITYDYTISNIANSSSTGIGLTAPSTGDKRVSNLPTGITDGLGFINGTDIVFIHTAIPSDAAYYINYTNNPSTTAAKATIGNGVGAIHTAQLAVGDCGVGWCSEGSSTSKILKIGSNATAQDWIVPTVSSAEILKSNPKQVRVTMSENVVNVNSTWTDFIFTTLGGGNDAVPATLLAQNATYTTSGVLVQSSTTFYVNLQNPVTAGDVLTIAYNPGLASAGVGVENWITDSVDSTRYVSSGAAQSAEWKAAGHGNRLANFTAISITNWIPIGFDGSSGCYDCSAPIVTAVQVSLDGSTPVTVTNDNAVQINAGNGDTVSVMVTIADNTGADTLTFAGLYTNFGSAPDNLFYANNFDSFKQMSTSYYEWNARADDTAFGNTDAITWDEATATVNPDGTQTITYTMTINDSIDSSQVWVDLGDLFSNYAKSALPITLEVAGPPAITFASDDSQQVVSYFNESILLAIVSQWTATSSDDATNVEQLSSVLGIEDQLPTWTTSLASWVSDDKIDVADMIVAVEYVINQ